MRRFIVTMYQKGLMNRGLGSEYKKHITYEKTTKSSVQIINVDFDMIEKEYEERKNWELEHDGLVTSYNPIRHIEYVLGIGKTDPYRFRSELREIKPHDKDGYCSMDKSYITKETDKAYYIEELSMWIPKSQTILEDNNLHVKRWVIEKSF